MTRSGTADFGADLPLAPAEYDTAGVIGRSERILMARAGEMAVLAAHDALRDAGMERGDPALEASSIYLGCGLGGAEALQDGYEYYFRRKTRRSRPTTVPLIMPSGPAAHISMHFGVRGPTLTYSIACASSAAAIGEAFRAVRDGYTDTALAGGAEAMLNDGSVAAWQRLGVLAADHPEGPSAASRPFSRTRSGFVLGEGAALLVLESEASAAARGVHAIGEIVGYGASSDAHNITEPSVSGQVTAMRAALAEAGIGPERIGYLNAHGAGTPVGDVVEISAIRETFGDHADRLAVSSTKGVHGHLVGAAGALEATLTVLALRDGMIPPTAHLTDPDPECDLDCVPCVGREDPSLEYAFSNSFAFGGSNVSLVFRRV
jgi:3-oxoacyl-[acyl-carrier-protein] synthase II